MTRWQHSIKRRCCKHFYDWKWDMRSLCEDKKKSVFFTVYMQVNMAEQLGPDINKNLKILLSQYEIKYKIFFFTIWQSWNTPFTNQCQQQLQLWKHCVPITPAMWQSSHLKHHYNFCKGKKADDLRRHRLKNSTMLATLLFFFWSPTGCQFYLLQCEKRIRKRTLIYYLCNG